MKTQVLLLDTLVLRTHRNPSIGSYYCMLVSHDQVRLYPV